jgi:hypothetical protein
LFDLEPAVSYTPFTHPGGASSPAKDRPENFLLSKDFFGENNMLACIAPVDYIDEDSGRTMSSGWRPTRLATKR